MLAGHPELTDHEHRTDHEHGTGDEHPTGHGLAVSARPTIALSPASTQIGRGIGGEDLFPLPDLEVPDPATRIQREPSSFSRGRVCGRDGCRERVGIARPGRPPVTKGTCPACGHPFSFEAKLKPGDLVGDQYEVIGYLAHGGLGWVYLAKDHHLDGNLVVLKGLINTNDQQALKLAVTEREFLTRLDHPNIVRIFNSVTHPDPESEDEHTGYIVMEYVDGLALREIIEIAARGERPFGDLPLLVEHVLIYGIEILAAFEYLHGQGLLYCDMKPDNVIQSRNRVKVIDLGAVRPIDDRVSPVVGTPGFQVSAQEIAAHGLSVRSDLHTLGRTLQDLFRVASDEPAPRPPPAATVPDPLEPDGSRSEPGPARRGDPGGEPVLGTTAGSRTAAGPRAAIGLGAESCRRVVKRATAVRPEERFASAAEMAEQLRGVLREVLSLRDGYERPAPSARFAPTTALLDAGLGAIPSLRRWTRPDADQAAFGSYALGGRPAPLQAAVELPVPRTDPSDLAAEFLSTVGAGDPRRLLDKLTEFTAPSVEIELCRFRAYLQLAATVDDADERLRSAEQALAAADRRSRPDWRAIWHRGLLSLARGAVAAAAADFDAVYDALPGEEAPKLALGFCAEVAGRTAEAERFYLAVWSRDRSQAGAAFGLARLLLARGRRQDAVAVLDQVPRVSRHFDAARIAAIQVLLTAAHSTADSATGPGSGTGGGSGTAGGPAAADFTEVCRRLPELYLDAGEADGESRTRLVTVVQEAAFRCLPVLEGRRVHGGDILGDPVTREGLRLRLERSYRRLAWQAPHPDDHGVLVDLANAVRPRTLR